MAFTDDYAIIGAAADNFDCDATGGWTQGGVGNAVSLNTTTFVEGTGALDLLGSGAGDATWYQDVSAGSRFKITEKDLHFWLFYIKGKGANFLSATADAVRVRLYFGGTTAYAEYRVTELGDQSLNFGWNMLQCSGMNLRGGITSGTPDFDADVFRVMLILNFASSNVGGTGGSDAPFQLDSWFAGTKIVVSEGTPAVPTTFSALQTYAEYGGTRAAFPLGLVTVQGNFVNLRCGLDIGNGSDGTAAEGNLSDNGKFVLFNQESEEVKHNLVVKNFSSLILGTQEVLTDGSYPVSGCQVVLPADRYSDISVEDGGTLELYDCKLYRWRYIYLGAAAETVGSIIKLLRVDVDSCETIYLRATGTLDFNDVEIHDNRGRADGTVNQHCGEILQPPDTFSAVLVHDCDEGVYFRPATIITVQEYLSRDNVTYDLGILEAKIAALVNSEFDPSKIRRLT